MLQVKIVPVTAFAQNCSIVWDSETKEAVLIDAGGEPEKLKQEVEALGQNLFAELQEKAAKWAENEPNISEWIREKCRQFGFEVKSEDGD